MRTQGHPIKNGMPNKWNDFITKTEDLFHKILLVRMTSFPFLTIPLHIRLL